MKLIFQQGKGQMKYFGGGIALIAAGLYGFTKVEKIAGSSTIDTINKPLIMQLYDALTWTSYTLREEQKKLQDEQRAIDMSMLPSDIACLVERAMADPSRNERRKNLEAAVTSVTKKMETIREGDELKSYTKAVSQAEAERETKAQQLTWVALGSVIAAAMGSMMVWSGKPAIYRKGEPVPSSEI